MKRRALVFLTVVALALFMAPAIGVQAGDGVVKLVTSAELADPDPDRNDTTFEGLDSAEYVSTILGADPAAGTRDTFGTMYVAIEDNDSGANVYTSRVYSIVESGSGSQTIIPMVDGSAIDIVDRNRDGSLDADDIDVYVFTEDVGTTLPPGSRPILKRNIVNVSSTGVTVSGEARDILTGTTYFTIRFDTSVQDSLVEADGTSRVRVSSGRDIIDVIAKEANINGIDADPALTDANDPTSRNVAYGGVEADDVAATTAQSSDSGVFLGAFGLIQSAWKDLLSGWAKTTVAANAAGRDPRPVGAGNAVTELEINLGVSAAGTDSPTQGTAGTGDDAKRTYTFATVTLNIALQEPNPNDQAQTQDVTEAALRQFISDSNGDGVVDRHDVTVKFDSASAARRFSVTSVTLSDYGVETENRATLRIVIEGVNENDEIDQDDTDNRPGVDKLVFSYATTVSVDALVTAIESDLFEDGTAPPTRTQADAFQDLDADDADALSAAVGKHWSALYAYDSTATESPTNAPRDETPATALINRLLGVANGNTVQVSYRDPGEGTKRASAIADLTGPTVTITSPANDSFTKDASFEGAFSVTDAGAGIPEDAEEGEIALGVTYVAASIALSEESGDAIPVDTATVEAAEDDDISGGFVYELDVDIRDEARAQEDDGKNLVAVITITARDQVGNVGKKTAKFTIDVIDPVLLRVLTGWGVKLDTKVDQAKADDEKGAYVLVENVADSIVLIFNGPVDGDALDANDVSVGGASVDSLLWLNNTGQQRISTGSSSDVDFNSKTSGGAQADEDVQDEMDLLFETLGQDARHLVFLALTNDLSTDAEPGVEIASEDLRDLAENTNSRDHELDARDRLWPSFTVTLGQKLSNDALDVTISSSEALERRPSAAVKRTGDEGDRRLTVVAGGSNEWTVDADRQDLGLDDEGDDDGVYTVIVTGEDENGNEGRNATQKWEYDTLANGGATPVRTSYADLADDKPVEIETDAVVFVSFEFPGEADEYGDASKDSQKGVTVTSLALETLDDDDEVVSTADVLLNTAQTSNSVQYVVALAEMIEGDYNLVVGYADAVGNTGEYKFRFDIVPQKPVTVQIRPGWNLISIPGIPQDKAIGRVLADTSVSQVWSFNNETKIWEFARQVDGVWDGTLIQIEDGRAYFVRSTTFDGAEVLLSRFSPQVTPPQYNVSAGWNGVGYTPGSGQDSIAVGAYLAPLGSSWSVIRSWNPVTLRYESAWRTGQHTDGFGTVDGKLISAAVEAREAVEAVEADPDATPAVAAVAAVAAVEAEDAVYEQIAVVEAGKGYMLYTSSAGTLAG